MTYHKHVTITLMSQSTSRNTDRYGIALLTCRIYFAVTVVLCWTLSGSCFCHPKY